MLDLHAIRKDPDALAAALARRGEAGLDAVLELDRSRREMLVQVETLKKTRNDNSRRIGETIKQGGDADALKAETKRLGAEIAAIEARLAEVEGELERALHGIPNTPHESVPSGGSEADNEEVRRWGDPPSFDGEPLAHWDIGAELGIIDFERAAKVAGARFAVLRGDGARLERALAHFMLDLHTREHGYVEVQPPFMVNDGALFGTGQLPKFAEDLFRCEPGGYSLIPTAEVPVTNLHADEILEPGSLPIAYCAYTPCFRSEAGSYGKDVRGLIRQHQFTKVELVRFAEPEHSYDQLELLTRHAETVLQRLELPYRVVTLCTGDLGFSAAKTYDLEVWLPSQGTYREISSCSNFEDFQARRAKIRYRPEPGAKPRLLHTLNGSGLAVGRTLVAVLENHRQADGSVAIPAALRPYMDGRERIGPPAA